MSNILMNRAKANKTRTKEKEKMGDKKPKKNVKKKPAPKTKTARVSEESAKGKPSAGPKKKSNIDSVFIKAEETQPFFILNQI